VLLFGRRPPSRWWGCSRRPRRPRGGRGRDATAAVALERSSWGRGPLAQRAAAAVSGPTRREERLRIARELHDSLAHALVAINVQAGVSARTSADPKRPPLSRRSRTPRRPRSNDLRATLNVPPFARPPLRRRCGRRRPQRRCRGSSACQAAGLDVRAEVDLAGGIVTTPRVHAGYRVVQRPAHHVLRHSQAERARVVLSLPTMRSTSRSSTTSRRARTDPGQACVGWTSALARSAIGDCRPFASGGGACTRGCRSTAQVRDDPPIRVLVAEDQRCPSRILRPARRRAGHRRRRRSCHWLRRPVRLAAQLKPDVVVRDIRMPRWTAWMRRAGSSRIPTSPPRESSC